MSRANISNADLGYSTDQRDWISVQHRTFTFWVNQSLAHRGRHITTLEEGFQTGYDLVVLVEELSGKHILSKVVENPKTRFDRLQNCSNAIKFVELQGIKLVAIGPEDLVDAKLKLILGLVWMLILRYQIQKTSRGGNAKGELLAWVQGQVKPYNVPVTNFTNSFGDGRALSALVDSLAPGSIDVANLKPEDKKKNTENAIKLAQEKLAIPAMMEAEDFTEMEPDELSVMTYISYYRNAAEVPQAATVTASGAGLTTAVANQQATFTLTAVGSGVTQKDISIRIVSSASSVIIPHSIAQGSSPTEFIVTYTAGSAGTYQIEINFQSKPVSGSPYQLTVTGGESDAAPASTSDGYDFEIYGHSSGASSASATSSGSAAVAQTGAAGAVVVYVGQTNTFGLRRTAGAPAFSGSLSLQVSLKKTSGSGSATQPQIKVKPGSEAGTFVVEYVVAHVGTYEVEVTEASVKGIRGSPFSLEARVDPSGIRIEVDGEGVKSATVAQNATFRIRTISIATGKGIYLYADEDESESAAVKSLYLGYLVASGSAAGGASGSSSGSGAAGSANIPVRIRRATGAAAGAGVYSGEYLIPEGSVAGEYLLHIRLSGTGAAAGAAGALGAGAGSASGRARSGSSGGAAGRPRSTSRGSGSAAGAAGLGSGEGEGEHEIEGSPFKVTVSGSGPRAGEFDPESTTAEIRYPSGAGAGAGSGKGSGAAGAAAAGSDGPELIITPRDGTGAIVALTPAAGAGRARSGSSGGAAGRPRSTSRGSGSAAGAAGEGAGAFAVLVLVPSAGGRAGKSGSGDASHGVPATVSDNGDGTFIVRLRAPALQAYRAALSASSESGLSSGSGRARSGSSGGAAGRPRSTSRGSGSAAGEGAGDEQEFLAEVRHGAIAIKSSPLSFRIPLRQLLLSEIDPQSLAPSSRSVDYEAEPGKEFRFNISLSSGKPSSGAAGRFTVFAIRLGSGPSSSASGSGAASGTVARIEEGENGAYAVVFLAKGDGDSDSNARYLVLVFFDGNLVRPDGYLLGLRVGGAAGRPRSASRGSGSEPDGSEVDVDSLVPVSREADVSGEPGKPLRFRLNLSGSDGSALRGAAGNARVVVRPVRSSSAGTATARIVEEDGVYYIVFDPSSSSSGSGQGEYLILVYLNGQLINPQGFFFRIAVIGSGAGSARKRGTGASVFVLGFNSDAGSSAGDYSAKVTGPNNKSITATVEEDTKSGAGHYNVRFSFEEEGDYTIVVTGPKGVVILNQSINPVTGTISTSASGILGQAAAAISGTVGAISHAASAAVEAVAEAVGAGAQPVRLETSSAFVVRLELPKGLNASDLNADVTGPDGKVLRASIEEDPKQKGRYVIRFTFEYEGDYVIVIRGAGGDEIIRTSVNPAEATSSSRTVSSSSRTSANFVVNFELPKAVNVSELSADVTGPNGAAIKSTVSEDPEAKGTSSHRYNVRFAFEQEGDYTIVLRGAGGVELVRQTLNPVSGTVSVPITQQVSEAVSAVAHQVTEVVSKGVSAVTTSSSTSTTSSTTSTSRSSSSSAPAPAPAKRSARFTHFCCGVEVLDESGNAVTNGGDSVTMRVEGGGKGSEELKGTVKDQGNGKYIASFVPPRSGRYTVHVLVDGVDIPGSPYHLTRD